MLLGSVLFVVGKPLIKRFACVVKCFLQLLDQVHTTRERIALGPSVYLVCDLPYAHTANLLGYTFDAVGTGYDGLAVFLNQSVFQSNHLLVG